MVRRPVIFAECKCFHFCSTTGWSLNKSPWLWVGLLEQIRHAQRVHVRSRTLHLQSPPLSQDYGGPEPYQIALLAAGGMELQERMGDVSEWKSLEIRVV